jgi:zinc transport system ATP-binding protein
LELHDVSVDYGHDQALVGASLRIDQGEFVGILGPNGAGKSTLLRAALGLVRPRTGSVKLFGKPLAAFDEWVRVAYVSQNASHVDGQFPATALEVVLLGRVARRGLFRWLGAEDHAMALEALKEVDAAHLADRRIGTLSGGERQRVLLAKALCGAPDLLFLDEPTTGVDPGARADFYQLLDHLNHDHDLTVVLVSHDTEALVHSAHRIVAVNRKIVYDDTSERFREQERIGDLYGLAITHGEGTRHGSNERRPA